MAQKLKKSKQKPRSARSIQMEEEKKALIEEYEKRETFRKNKAERSGIMMLAYYSLAFGILSILVDYMGIIGLIALGLGIAAMIRLKGNRNREFYAACGGIALAVVRIGIEIYRLIMYLNA